MKRQILLFWAAALGLCVPATDPATAVDAKLRWIESGRVPAGSAVSFTVAELNAYARRELPAYAPAGVRDLRLELGNSSGTGYALIDFLKLRQGASTPWLLARMIEGEKPVKVQVSVRSSGGTATVFLEKVEISGLAVSGAPLDFLIRTFFQPLFPEARINEPFALQNRVDRIEVNPVLARVVMKR